jgi:hypothetical protein
MVGATLAIAQNAIVRQQGDCEGSPYTGTLSLPNFCFIILCLHL